MLESNLKTLASIKVLSAAQKVLTRITLLQVQTCVICMAWPGEEPEWKSINLYSKENLSRHIYKSISLFACVYKTISL